MSDMSESRGYVIGPEARVVLVRRHEGYAVAVVHNEGPFSHDQAEQMASALRRQVSGKLTKADAASLLGISQKGVDYLRSQGLIDSEQQDNGRVLIDADSVRTYMDKRDG